MAFSFGTTGGRLKMKRRLGFHLRKSERGGIKLIHWLLLVDVLRSVEQSKVLFLSSLPLSYFYSTEFRLENRGMVIGCGGRIFFEKTRIDKRIWPDNRLVKKQGERTHAELRIGYSAKCFR